MRRSSSAQRRSGSRMQARLSPLQPSRHPHLLQHQLLPHQQRQRRLLLVRPPPRDGRSRSHLLQLRLLKPHQLCPTTNLLRLLASSCILSRARSTLRHCYKSLARFRHNLSLYQFHAASSIHRRVAGEQLGSRNNMPHCNLLTHTQRAFVSGPRTSVLIDMNRGASVWTVLTGEHGKDQFVRV